MLTFIPFYNIFDMKVDAIVNPVNCVGVMGKGLAKQFKERYIDNYVAYRAMCESGTLTIGKLFIFDTKIDQPKYIINFPVKQHWKDNAEYDYIDLGLTELAKRLPILNIVSVAIPALGCGCGKLKWSIVKKMITKRLDTLSNKITVIEPT